jgi:hypothetical protein
MTNTPDLKNVQPRATTSRLENGFRFTISDGLWCPWCGETIRSCDAESLEDDGARLVCRRGHLVLHYEPR